MSGTWRAFLADEGPEFRDGLPAALQAFCDRVDVTAAQRAVAVSDVWRASLGSKRLTDAIGTDAVLDLFRSVGCLWSAGPWGPNALAIVGDAFPTAGGWYATATPVRFENPPDEPMTLYRGCAAGVDPWEVGLSWTTDRVRAVQYARLRDRRTGGAVWTTEAPPTAILARLSEYGGGLGDLRGRRYTEIVVDPDAADMTATDGQ